jgi:hypothetical protein
MSQNSRNQGFSNYICLMIEGSESGPRAGSGSGSIPLTNGSGSGRPKNTWIRWIRIREAQKHVNPVDPDPETLEKCRLCVTPVAHNCRAAHLGGEGGADGGGAAGNVLIAAGLRHHGERVIPDRSPVLSTSAQETLSRDCLIQIFFLTCFPLDTRLKHFFIEIFYKFAEKFSVSKTPAAMS